MNVCKEELFVDTSIGSRRKGKHRKKLKTQEKLEILKKVVIEKEMEKEVAREFRISIARVS
jgi:hypothetical protein